MTNTIRKINVQNCACNNIDFQTYDNTILLGYYEIMRQYRNNRAKAGLPENGIDVDRCLADEIIDLWKAGIRTYGCCCGHNKIQGYINVDEEDFSKAQALGYEKYVFPNDPSRDDTIIPKSIGRFGVTS